jgi:hypothetical protein
LIISVIASRIVPFFFVKLNARIIPVKKAAPYHFGHNEMQRHTFQQTRPDVDITLADRSGRGTTR